MAFICELLRLIFKQCRIAQLLCELIEKRCVGFCFVTTPIVKSDKIANNYSSLKKIVDKRINGHEFNLQFLEIARNRMPYFVYINFIFQRCSSQCKVCTRHNDFNSNGPNTKFKPVDVYIRLLYKQTLSTGMFVLDSALREA